MKLHDYYKNTEARTDAWSDGSRRNDSRDSLEEALIKLPGLHGRWLDIGCQAGGLLGKLHHHFDEAFGVDIGDYQNHWGELPAVNFRLHDLDEEPIPFPDGHFDIVTCFMVIEHVFDVFGAVKEISRLTAEGGTAVIEVPNAGYVKHLFSLLRGRVPRTGSQDYPFNERQGWDGQHLHYFTLRETREIFDRYGLRLVTHTSRGKYPTLRRLAPSLLYSSLILTFQKKDLLNSKD